jgi:D-alanine-D-alanine ligase
VSAAAVCAALDSHHHEVVAVGIDKEGGWHLADRGSSESLSAVGTNVQLLTPGGALLTEEGSEIEVDAVFPVLHGPYGEDGTIQGLFEMAGLPYVGAGVLSSAIGMDKDVAKRLFIEAGLPCVNSVTIRARAFHDSPADSVDMVLENLALPVFVKPASLGSSVGISRVEVREDLKGALSLAFEHGDKAVVEEGVTAREIEVAVLDGPRTSLPGEIVPPAGGWYDYEAKYRDDGTVLHVPADLSSEQIAAAQQLASRAFEVLECSGLARVDFFLEPDRGFLINEVNTMPGMTSRSMFPLLWEATGIKYPDLIDGLVRSAIGPS